MIGYINRIETLGQAKDIEEGFFEELKGIGDLEGPFKDALDGEKVRSGRMLHWLMRDCLVGTGELKGLDVKGLTMVGDAVHVLPILAD